MPDWSAWPSQRGYKSMSLSPVATAITTGTAARLLGLTPIQFRRLAAQRRWKPVGDTPHPLWRVATVCRLVGSAVVAAIRARPPGRLVVDITGRRFGRLIVLHLAQERAADRRPRWRCLCDCGAEVVIDGARLRADRREDCGQRCPLRPLPWLGLARRLRDEGNTLAQIAALVGVSRQRVHEVLAGKRRTGGRIGDVKGKGA
jgi:hypothetical protein